MYVCINTALRRTRSRGMHIVLIVQISAAACLLVYAIAAYKHRIGSNIYNSATEPLATDTVRLHVVLV